MKIDLNEGNKRGELIKALAKLGTIDPTGRIFDLLAGQKLPRAPEELTPEDLAKIAAAEAKRQRKADKRMK